jgi:hypothetical protein
MILNGKEVTVWKAFLKVLSWNSSWKDWQKKRTSLIRTPGNRAQPGTSQMRDKNATDNWTSSERVPSP